MPGYEWITAGDLSVHFTLRADPLTAVMLVMVTFVSLLVAIYAAGYMHGDPGYPRFFAAIGLFVFSMTMLVLSSNFLLLYVFWEAVGLCSYLLIGFWFRKPEAAAAAKKAFLVNRIGDFGFALGIFLTWYYVGESLFWNAPAGKQLLDYDVVFAAAGKIAEAHPTGIVVICLLLFAGAVGKSAQFPLHVWLPDAMEGPTPVSALIHAATMVTAGVYMVARCSPLFDLAPTAQVIVAGIGGITALLAALIALTQYDLKRVMAYSTVSQLGLMFMALGSAAGAKGLLTFAVVAAIFHLFTHAFFKALLFLASGSVMHSMGDVIDMRRFSGLRHTLKTTHWTFLCGAVALAGIPPFSGFWSKDEILVCLNAAAHDGPYAGYFELLLDMAVLTSLLTSFYVFRAYFMTFWGPEHFPHEAGHHPHDAPPSMAIPLKILAVCALGIGFVTGPPTHWIAGYLEKTPGLPHHEFHESAGAVMVIGSMVALAGLAVAWLLYVYRPALLDKLTQVAGKFTDLSLNKFYIDEIYAWIIVRPLRILALLCQVVDKYFVDQIVDLVGSMPARIGQVFRPVQNGMIQSYALVMAVGLTVLVVSMALAF
ncbi:MAG: NADH-quinone oxidoreductase subunit L [Planctomycetota bacterium]